MATTKYSATATINAQSSKEGMVFSLQWDAATVRAAGINALRGSTCDGVNCS